MKSPQSRFTVKMFSFFSSHLCYLAGHPAIPLPNDDSPLIFLGDVIPPPNPFGPGEYSLANLKGFIQ